MEGKNRDPVDRPVQWTRTIIQSKRLIRKLGFIDQKEKEPIDRGMSMSIHLMATVCPTQGLEAESSVAATKQYNLVES